MKKVTFVVLTLLSLIVLGSCSIFGNNTSSTTSTSSTQSTNSSTPSTPSSSTTDDEEDIVTLTVLYTLYNPKNNELIETFYELPTAIGSASETQKYSCNTHVDLFATANKGYTFLGWYSENQILSNEANYRYMMWDENFTIEARFEYTLYFLTTWSNNSDLGEVIIRNGNSQTFYDEETLGEHYNESVTIAAYSKTETQFLGWYDENNELVSTKAAYTFNMPNSDYTLEAKWDYFKITYDLGGGTNDSSNPTFYTTDTQDIILRSPTKEGDTFQGWEYNGEVITKIDTSNICHVHLKALWTYYTLTTNGNNSRAGSVSAYDNTKVTNGSSITITAQTNPGYTFSGWYKDDELLTPEVSYTFIMPAENLVYTAKWTVNTNTDYKVKHYLENINDDNYSLYETDNLTGTTDTLTSGSVKTYEGFTSPSITQVNIDGNGQTVIALYYTRNTYSVCLNKNIDSAGTITESETYKYGKVISIEAVTNPGYIFNGWYSGDELLTDELSYTFTMPASNLEYTANWTANVPSSIADATAVARGAAEYIWAYYFKTDAQSKTDDFKLPKRFVYEGYSVDISWDLAVISGTSDGIYLDETKSDADYQAVHVGYYLSEISEQTTYTLTPTFTCGDSVVLLADVVDEEKAFFTYFTPVFILDTRAEWDANTKDKVYNIKGVVLDVIHNSASEGSFYFQDSEGYGYYAYLPEGSVKTGDIVVVTGKRRDYSGQQEFARGCTVHFYEDEIRNPIRHNATNDFAAAPSNSVFNSKYQNNLVVIENCIPQSHTQNLDSHGNDTNAYYYFTVVTGTAQYSVYISSYFLTDDQKVAFRTAWDEAVANSRIISIYGISTVYSSQIYIYPSTAYPAGFEVTGNMTIEGKLDATLNEVKDVISESYDGAIEVALPTASSLYSAVSIAWELVSPIDNANVKIEDGKLKIVAIDGSFEEVKVKATVILNGVSKDITLTSEVIFSQTSIASFFDAKDSESVQYLRGYVVAAGGDGETAGSFVLADGTGFIYSYDKIAVSLGDEVIVAGVYFEYGENKFPQLKNTTLVRIVSSGNNFTGEVKYNLTDNAAYRAELTADESENKTASAAKYAGQMVLVSGYLHSVTNNGNTYINLYAEESATTTQVAQLYSKESLTALVDTQVDIYGYVRGVGNNYPVILVQAVVAKDAAYTTNAVPQELVTKSIIGVTGNKLNLYDKSSFYVWSGNPQTLYQFNKTDVIKNTADLGEIEYIEVIIVSTYSNNLPTVKAAATADALASATALGDYSVDGSSYAEGHAPITVKVGQKSSENTQTLNAFTFTYTPEAGAHYYEIRDGGNYAFQVSAVNVYYK